MWLGYYSDTLTENHQIPGDRSTRTMAFNGGIVNTSRFRDWSKKLTEKAMIIWRIFFYTNYTSVSRIYKYFTDLNLIVFDRFVRYHKERRERERRKYIKRVVYEKRDILIEMWYKRSTVKICHFIFNSLDWQYPIDYGNNLVDSIGNSIGIE